MDGSTIEEAYDHCRDLVRRGDKDRFLASLFAPADRRRHLFALYAFNLEIARVREMVSDALPGEVRLQWWSEALAGCGHGEVRRHPVAAALLDTMELCAISAEPFIDIIEARTFDLYDEPMATLRDLELYARATSSVPMELAARMLGAADDRAVREVALHAGTAYAIVGLLRALPFHSRRGKLFLPEEVLARHGVPSHDVLAASSSPALGGALEELRSLAGEHLERTRALIGVIPPEIAPAFLPAALVGPYLERMRRGDYDPFAGVEIPQWRRQWALWRAARRARRP